MPSGCATSATSLKASQWSSLNLEQIIISLSYQNARIDFVSPTLSDIRKPPFFIISYCPLSSTGSVVLRCLLAAKHETKQ